MRIYICIYIYIYMYSPPSEILALLKWEGKKTKIAREKMTTAKWESTKKKSFKLCQLGVHTSIRFFPLKLWLDV